VHEVQVESVPLTNGNNVTAEWTIVFILIYMYSHNDTLYTLFQNQTIIFTVIHLKKPMMKYKIFNFREH
jgi:hypothetical protein